MSTAFHTELNPTVSPSSSQASFNPHDCPECSAGLTMPDGAESQVVACPECGQCVGAPTPWGCEMTAWSLVRPQWPFKYRKHSSWAGHIAFGIALCLGAFFPILHNFARMGLVCLGTAFAFEGVSRFRLHSRKQAESRSAIQVPTPDPTREFGALKAAFVSKDSSFDALTVSLIGLAVACGGGWAFSWMGQDGVVHSKLLMCLIVTPIATCYAFYRAVRMLFNQQSLLIREHGMHVTQNDAKTSFAWTDAHEITAAHIDDMIEEDAIELKLSGRPELRLTRDQFPDLETLWERILEEAREQIEQGQISVQYVDRSAQ